VSFLLTGVFDSLERNEAEDLIRKYGGRTVNTVSGKLNYIIVGDEAGPSKLAKVLFLPIDAYMFNICLLFFVYMDIFRPIV